MLRYCTECKKEFDFPVSDFTGTNELRCPECGGIIDRNSRAPADNSGTDKTEAAIGRIVSKAWHMAYIFYLCVAVVGIIAYFLKLDTVLYVSAGVSVGVYILQLITGTSTFRSGMIFVPAGAVAGYLLGGVSGMCLGVHIVFFVRHILRDVLYTLVAKLLGYVNRL